MLLVGHMHTSTLIQETMVVVQLRLKMLIKSDHLWQLFKLLLDSSLPNAWY